MQPEYNLIPRGTLEGELADVCTDNGLAVCTYSALASGFLTGKYQRGVKVSSPRSDHVERYLDDPTALTRLGTLRTVAAKHGATPAQVALAWQLYKPFVTTPIASATSPTQLHELVAAVHLTLDADDVERLDAS